MSKGQTFFPIVISSLILITYILIVYLVLGENWGWSLLWKHARFPSCESKGQSITSWLDVACRRRDRPWKIKPRKNNYNVLLPLFRQGTLFAAYCSNFLCTNVWWLLSLYRFVHSTSTKSFSAHKLIPGKFHCIY